MADMVEIRARVRWEGTGYPEVVCDACGFPVRRGYRATVHFAGEPEEDFGARATVYLHADCGRRKRYRRFSDFR